MKQIRKITVGPDLKNGMHYIVGQDTFGGKIVDILPEEDGLQVYIEKNDEVKPWFFVKNQNIKIEYNLEY